MSDHFDDFQNKMVEIFPRCLTTSVNSYELIIVWIEIITIFISFFYAFLSDKIFN